jgi:hypothetical protein
MAVQRLVVFDEIVFGENIKSLGEMVMYKYIDTFYNIVFLGDVPPTANSYTFHNASDFAIYVPAESLEVYKAAPGFSKFADQIFPIE